MKLANSSLFNAAKPDLRALTPNRTRHLRASDGLRYFEMPSRSLSFADLPQRN